MRLRENLVGSAPMTGIHRYNDLSTLGQILSTIIFSS
jgi:hypothetical protein